MYYYVCHTCDNDETFPDHGSAQTAFNEHARQQHEVVLRRVESPIEELDLKHLEEPRSADVSEDATGTEGSDTVAE